MVSNNDLDELKKIVLEELMKTEEGKKIAEQLIKTQNNGIKDFGLETLKFKSLNILNKETDKEES